MRLPARLVTLADTHRVVLLDLSLTGAKVATDALLRIGSEVVLEWGRNDAFGEVVWCQRGYAGIAFFEPIPVGIVLATRELDEAAQLPEDRELVRQTARQWVEGTTRL